MIDELPALRRAALHRRSRGAAVPARLQRAAGAGAAGLAFGPVLTWAAAGGAGGAAATAPDNLYMIGTFRLAPGQALVLDFEPPETRYWSVALES
ncbi:hypothetical protein OSH22_24025, partial [Mycobacterium ulcerans]